MRAAAIGIGFFLLFALAFVGGLGEPFYTYSACGSAASIILAGLCLFSTQLRIAGLGLVVLAVLSYLPVVYQRFTWPTGVDWGGVPLDAAYISFLAYLIHAYGRGVLAKH